MAKPHNVSWETHAKSLEEINARLAVQLNYVNTMLHELYTRINNHESRIEALE